jgi:hypothetical protein
LCVPVADPARHAALAGMAKTYLAYCDCTRPNGEKMTIAAAVTSGDSDNLMVGRNGVFYDRKGRDWDATVTRIVDNPISVGQAFWAPYKKLVRLIEEQVAKRAAAAEATSDAQLNAAAAFAANAGGAAAEPDKPAPPPRRVDVGTVAALGVAVGALGAFLTTVLGYITGLFALPFWMIVLVACGIVLAISTPSMLIAWLKLRQRNLGPILDANGWAINGRVAMNVSFGASLTKVAALPPGSRAALDDPFAEKPGLWWRLALLALGVCFLASLVLDLGPRFTGRGPGGPQDLPWMEQPAPGPASAPAP